PRGYYQEGKGIFCLHCGSVINPASIGRSGGCNPIPLGSRVLGGDLVLSAADLRAGVGTLSSTAAPRLYTMYLRLLAESLRRGTRRKLLAISAVALGTLGATALGEVVLASGDRLASEMSSYGANVVLAPKGSGETLPESDLAKVRTIFWKNNIAAL